VRTSLSLLFRTIESRKGLRRRATALTVHSKSGTIFAAESPIKKHARNMLTRILLATSLVTMTGTSFAQEQRWLTPADGSLSTDGIVRQFDLPSGPTTVALDAGGVLWFTLSQANAIGRINPDGSGFAQFAIPTPDSSPRIIAYGADGNMWFSEHEGNKMGRITPDGAMTEFELPTPASQPRAIALSADGNIWIGMFAAGKIGRITPEGVLTEFVIPTPDSGPRALAAGPGGDVWFSEFKASKIGRISPDGAIIEYDLPRPSAGPGDITAGADGNMWFVELGGVMDGIEVDGNRVGRITPQGVVTEFPIPSAGGTPINIAAGPDGNVWYTKGEAIGRVTPQGEITEFPISDGPARAVGISAGSDRQPPERLVNRLYFTDPLNNRIGFLSFE
jgi:virginiamycin B lyase